MSSAAASAAQRAGLRINFDDLYRKLLEDPTLQLDQAVVARMSTAMQSYQVRFATDPVGPPPTLPRQPARAGIPSPPAYPSLQEQEQEGFIKPQEAL